VNVKDALLKLFRLFCRQTIWPTYITKRYIWKTKLVW